VRFTTRTVEIFHKGERIAAPTTCSIALTFVRSGGNRHDASRLE
jgi:hypothetical protein